MATTYQERREAIDQKIRQLQNEKRKLDRQQKRSEKKHRDHVMIVTGAHFLTHFAGAEAKMLEMSDDEIRAWVDSKFSRT